MCRARKGLESPTAARVRGVVDRKRLVEKFGTVEKVDGHGIFAITPPQAELVGIQNCARLKLLRPPLAIRGMDRMSQAVG